MFRWIDITKNLSQWQHDSPTVLGPQFFLVPKIIKRVSNKRSWVDWFGVLGCIYAKYDSTSAQLMKFLFFFWRGEGRNAPHQARPKRQTFFTCPGRWKLEYWDQYTLLHFRRTVPWAQRVWTKRGSGPVKRKGWGKGCPRYGWNMKDWGRVTQ